MPVKVLVIDDEIAIRRLLRNTLERAGYAVFEAMDGRGGIACVAADRPDAVLLNLGLPDRDGLGLVPPLRRDERIAVLVVSARESIEEKVAALDLGADDYVTKPFDAEELLARLRVALRHRDALDPAPAIVWTGRIAVDLDRRIGRRDDAEVHLTRKEYDVLALLARHLGRVVTHDRMIAAA